MPPFEGSIGKTAAAADVGVLRDRPAFRDRLIETDRGEIPESADAINAIPNGAAAAAILAAGIGCFAVGLFALAGDAWPAVARFFTFYRPTGPLSGVTTSAIVLWLVVWYALSRRWGGRTVAIGKVNLAAFVFLALGVLLTLPPFMDLLQGK